MTFQSSSLLLIRLISDCVQYERLWKLVSRQLISKLSIFNTFTVFDNFQLSTFNNFQHSTTFKIQLWRFNNFQHSTTSISDNFQHSTLTTIKIQQLSIFNNFQCLTTFNIWQLSNIQQLSTFNFDNFQSSTTFNIRQLSRFNNFQHSTLIT